MATLITEVGLWLGGLNQFNAEHLACQNTGVAHDFFCWQVVLQAVKQQIAKS